MSAASEYLEAVNFLPFFPANAMVEYDGIFAAGAAAADAEIARLTAYWAERAAESEAAFAEADVRSAEIVRRRREYETTVIFVIYPLQMRCTRDPAGGRPYTYRRYVNLGPRLDWSRMDEGPAYVDSTPAPAGAYYRTAAELGLDNATALRHYEEKTYLAEYGDARDSTARRASEHIKATERAWARTLACAVHDRRAHALAAFAAAQ